MQAFNINRPLLNRRLFKNKNSLTFIRKTMVKMYMSVRFYVRSIEDFGRVPSVKERGRAGLSPLAFFAAEKACKKELKQWLDPSRMLSFQIVNIKNFRSLLQPFGGNILQGLL
jgi:hypothetical protein